MNKKIYGIAIPALLMLSSCLGSSSNLEIDILDIGCADCSVFVCNDKVSLIDTGEDDDGSKIVILLNKMKIKSIDKLIITHFDKDHVGGADSVISNFDIDTIYVPDYTEESTDYTNFVNACSEKNISPVVITEATNISFSSLNATLYASSDNSLKDNNMSLITKITHGKNTFLFTGDIQNKRMLEIIDEDYLPSTFLKVPYHGKYESFTSAFFKKVSPEYAVICDSNKNPADEQCISALKEIGAKVYETKNSKIIVNSNGKSISVKQ